MTEPHRSNDMEPKEWCPKCRANKEKLQEAQEEIRKWRELCEAYSAQVKYQTERMQLAADLVKLLVVKK